MAALHTDRLRWCRGAAMALVAVLAVAEWVHGDGDAPAPPDPLFASVRNAIGTGQTRRTAARGIHDAKRAFAELPPASVLIGFECGLGKFWDIENIFALRAIYRTANGIELGPDHGPFEDRFVGAKKVVKTRVLRKVRVQAPLGYAVGSITLRTGLNINGMGLTYYKVDGARLDPHKVLVSPWVGDRTGGGEASLGGEGGLFVGIHGCQDDSHVHSLGLIGLIPSAVVAPPVAELPPPVEQPAPPVPEQPGPPAGDHPPRPGEQRAAAVDPPVLARQADAPAPVAVAQTERPTAKAVQPERGSSWLMLGVGSIVTIGVAALSLMFLGSKKRDPRERPRKAKPPPLPVDAGDSDVDALPMVILVEEPEPATGIQAGLPRPSVPPAQDMHGVTLVCERCARVVRREPGAPTWCPRCGGALAPE